MAAPLFIPGGAMKISQTKQLSDQHKSGIYDIWNTEYPDHISYTTIADLETYLAGLKESYHFIIVNDYGGLMGWLVTFTREKERWFAMILHQELQGKGYGSRLLNAAKEREKALNGWVTDHDRDKKADGKPYRSPVDFYLKNGFEVLNDTRLEKGQLSTVKIRWETGR